MIHPLVMRASDADPTRYNVSSVDCLLGAITVTEREIVAHWYDPRAVVEVYRVKPLRMTAQERSREILEALDAILYSEFTA